MRLANLKVRNFECFGDGGVDIAIDDIVVLIGPNNVGKSAVLDAYETFASSGAEIGAARFCRENPAAAVEMTGTFVNLTESDIEKVGKWLHTDAIYGQCVKVRWTWAKPDEKGAKSSWDAGQNTWVSGGMGGWDSILASCIPAPIRLTPRDDPATTESRIVEILTTAVKAKLKSDAGVVAQLVQQLEQLSQQFHAEVQDELHAACEKISERIKGVFPGYEVEFTPAVGKFEPEKAIGTGSHISFRQGTSSAIPLAHQGTGLQRTFLWSALGALADLGRYKVGKAVLAVERAKMLLIDEPESFLHPPAVRAAREVLYGLASLEGWQVMATTHSAVFVDVSKPHTTIVRLERPSNGKQSTKMFATDKASFDEDERIRLRMLRACHPTVNEFFFAERVFLVEGETEHLVLGELLSRCGESWAATRHVVNCMGKANIPLFARILNQFGVPYTILHDADAPRVKSSEAWQKNGMWTMNQTISSVTSDHPDSAKCFKVVHVPDFEGYYFEKKLTKDKPFAAAQVLSRSDFDTAPELEKLRSLVNLLRDDVHPNVYEDIDGLHAKVKDYVQVARPQPVEAWQLA